MKNFLFTILAVFSLSLLFGIGNASANSLTEDDLLSEVKVFDENGDEIPYTKEELKQFIKFNSDKNTNLSLFKSFPYNYGPIEFSSNFWIGGGWRGIAFYNPVDTIIRVNGIAERFTIHAYYDDNGGAGSEAKSISLPGGWTGDVHVSAWSTMPRGYDYRFKVVNTDGKKFTIDNIQVWYD
ncbi:hypothetical protein P9E76_10910 [Schinkia azotoformans]|uniref:Uncharacterized protein n=1 Tax=Schinkia azotoformans LMG 9581 TaxID=1131731 RepID=K6D841_SCHAZ|nr:hypothetical protein [Schinkia azotoformans]EKN64454.1 hypothetical protein BAZO_13434 [Schinkia azotoformans LMG 9581]MEC1640140.1 hypothetical protein [Schinkia azotoformans]MEC1722381.1 hypothetical protein [Schinkia azotoformans]MEC1945553.1 hypothetical protein [Schinkia azotoformans]MED4411721.1 hypothetical protein [Schinkia azotoformans]